MTASPMPRPTVRLAYDDSDTISVMHSDARRCGEQLRLDRVAAKVTGPTPSIRYADFPREIAKGAITVSAAAQRLANALSLHLD